MFLLSRWSLSLFNNTLDLFHNYLTSTFHFLRGNFLLLVLLLTLREFSSYLQLILLDIFCIRSHFLNCILNKRNSRKITRPDYYFIIKQTISTLASSLFIDHEIESNGANNVAAPKAQNNERKCPIDRQSAHPICPPESEISDIKRQLLLFTSLLMICILVDEVPLKMNSRCSPIQCQTVSPQSNYYSIISLTNY